MNIEKLKELYESKNEKANIENLLWCESIFKNYANETFAQIAINYLYELIKLLGNTGNFDKFNIEQIESLVNNDSEIQELLKMTQENEYPKLKEFFKANDIVKENTYECINKKLLEYKMEQSRDDLNKDNNNAEIDLVNNQLVINKLNNNDFIKIKMFDKEKEIVVFSTGDNQFDENGNYKKDQNFPLTDEEINMLNWFINNVKIEDYKKEIVDYCNEEYSSWQYPDGTQKGPIGIDDVEDEINITAIAISIIKNENIKIPEISFYGECKCDEEHGICIGFRDKKFYGISSQDWIL